MLLKALVVGDYGVGKTSLIHRLVCNKFDPVQIRSTIVCDFMRKEIEIDGKEYTLILWDTGGHERFMPILSPMYYRNVCCCLFVFLIDNLESFDALENLKNQFMEVIGKENFPFVLVGNKLDLNEQRQVEIEKAKSWCTQNGGMPYVETSAKDGRGVFEAFEMVTKRFLDLSQDEQTLLLTKQSVVVPDTTNDNYSCC